jgi:2-keto-4-pentenoate hydratase/2-oxohepta-3-ene-1,7-dioic acid hydratase in catechol pathway
MRWVTYRGADEGGHRVGLVVDEAVYALEPGVDLIGLLGDDGSALRDAGERARRSPADVTDLAAVHLCSPIPRPPSIRDYSSFEEHITNGLRAIGQQLGDDWYEIPVFYFSNPNSLYGSGEPIRAPGGSTKMDYELEVAAIIGKPGRDLDAYEAESHVAGYCIYNDWSARDLQIREQKTIPVGPGKGKDFAQTFGPCLVTPDELEPFRRGAAFDLTMTATVNGREYSRGNLSDLYWSFGEMIAYSSRDASLVAGDIIACGTVGSGCILELSLRFGSDEYPWLQEGDEVVLEVEQLGRLENTVTFGTPHKPLRTLPDTPAAV